MGFDKPIDITPFLVEQHRSCRDEIVARLGFERRIIQMEIVVFAATIAAPTYEAQFDILPQLGIMISLIFIFVSAAFLRHIQINNLAIYTQALCIATWINPICFHHTGRTFGFADVYFHDEVRKHTVDPFGRFSLSPSTMLSYLIFSFGILSGVYYAIRLYDIGFPHPDVSGEHALLAIIILGIIISVLTFIQNFISGIAIQKFIGNPFPEIIENNRHVMSELHRQNINRTEL